MYQNQIRTQKRMWGNKFPYCFRRRSSLKGDTIKLRTDMYTCVRMGVESLKYSVWISVKQLLNGHLLHLPKAHPSILKRASNKPWIWTCLHFFFKWEEFSFHLYPNSSNVNLSNIYPVTDTNSYEAVHKSKNLKCGQLKTFLLMQKSHRARLNPV